MKREPVASLVRVREDVIPSSSKWRGILSLIKTLIQDRRRKEIPVGYATS